MIFVFKLILVILFSNSVLSNHDNLECIRKGVEAMRSDAKGANNHRDDNRLLESAQANLKAGIDLVHKRAQATRLDCYYDFTKKYWNGLKQISAELKDRLTKASSQTERSEAVSAIATMSQIMKCDEENRVKHINETFECTRIEELGGIETKFNSLYNMLRSSMFLSNIWETNKNKVIEGIINYDLQMYNKIYGEAKNCVARQKKTDKCTNIKMLVEELERFFSLFDLIDINHQKNSLHLNNT